jgi:hypothetical protein
VRRLFSADRASITLRSARSARHGLRAICILAGDRGEGLDHFFDLLAEAERDDDAARGLVSVFVLLEGNECVWHGAEDCLFDLHAAAAASFNARHECPRRADTPDAVTRDHREPPRMNDAA